VGLPVLPLSTREQLRLLEGLVLIKNHVLYEETKHVICMFWGWYENQNEKEKKLEIEIFSVPAASLYLEVLVSSLN
jgi:hypothetical protein